MSYISFKPPVVKDTKLAAWLVKVARLAFGLQIYSEEETHTWKKWIDGKGIYRKVVDCGALPNNTTKNTAHGVTFDTLISAEGIATSGSNWRRVPHADTGSLINQIKLNINSTNIQIITVIDYTSYDECYVVLEYTK